jgi:AraC-like DNA-binding protein
MIRADIQRHLHRQDLSIDQVARRHGISQRYVQTLFRREGTTFRDLVLQERLERAHSHLTDAGYAHLSISEIAFSCGFGDLSYFNQTFRRRYAMTPGDVRKAHQGGSSGR